MPKVTIITLPTEMLDARQPAAEKRRVFRRLSLKQVIQRGYAFLMSLLFAEHTLLSILAFLLGRVSIMGEFAPAGLAFFAAVVQFEGKRALMVGLWSIVGVLSSGAYYEAGIYVFVISLYFLWAEKFISRYKHIAAVPTFIFMAVLCGNLIVSLIKEFTLYNVLVAVFEAGIGMVLSYIFMYGGPLLTARQSTFYRNLVTSERLSCMVMMLATAVAGFGNVMVLEYSVRNMVGSLLIMAAALVGGAGLSATVGVIIGLIVGLSDGDSTLVVSIYAVAGVLAGVFRGLGKAAVIVGFILGSGIIILYFGQEHELIQVLSEYTIAGLLFLLVPGKYLVVWQNAIFPNEEQSITSSFNLNVGVTKINHIAEIFNDMAGIFNNIIDNTKETIRDDELAKTLTVIGEQVCVDCPNRSRCWEVDFYRTHHGILEILGQIEIRSLTIETMPNVFQENCINRKELLEKIKVISEHNQTLTFWQKKMVDQRQMVSEQMKATSAIIKNLAYEMAKVDYSDQQLSIDFQEKSAMLGCPLTMVRIFGVQGTRVIETYKASCNGNRECINTILPLATGLMKEKMTLRSECGKEAKRQKCKLTMEVVRRFDVESGMVSLAKEGQESCGDTNAIIALSKGRIALVLSDGMGSGSHAQEQSAMAIAMLQRLLVAGFDTDVAVKTVNSMLLLRSPEESFVTIDIAIIDTYSGNIEFLKVGSAPSFIKRVREVMTIKSSALPIGILQQIEIQPVQSVIVVGDFVVMVSDGIIDVPQSNMEKGNWLANFLRQTRNSDAQALAEQIIMQARKMSANQVSDDMTVLVAKIVERHKI